ncbi:MAG: CHASE2 domain-containing protein, partial [Siculibacillus sp.]|nr:CHASE2 domain-containing protein [Siculibacillus sp.]
MADRRPPGRDPFLAGVIAAVSVVSLLLLVFPGATTVAVERGFDAILAAVDGGRSPPEAELPVVVVDIDDDALDLVGPWPWRRRVVADLVEAIGSAGAAAVAIDVVFSEAEERSPAALARRLAAETERTDLADLARTLDDDDPRLAAVFSRTPVVLGFALSTAASPPPPGPPLLRHGPAGGVALWRMAGAEVPIAALAKPAAGLGATVL